MFRHNHVKTPCYHASIINTRVILYFRCNTCQQLQLHLQLLQLHLKFIYHSNTQLLTRKLSLFLAFHRENIPKYNIIVFWKLLPGTYEDIGNIRSNFLFVLFRNLWKITQTGSLWDPRAQNCVRKLALKFCMWTI